MRTAHKWKKMPGNVDKLHTSQIFESSNEYGIPDLKNDQFVPEWLLPVKQRVQYNKTEEEMKKGAVHFFVDDYHFEHIWTRPEQTFSLVQRTGNALTPDFSLYTDWPIVAQLWNTYRNRWMGAFWQSRGIKVIPSVSWSTKESYKFCFLGIEKGSNVAISTVGVNRDPEVKKLFIAGFEEMVKQIEPKTILVYGEKAPLTIEDYAETRWYPSYWKTMRDIVTKKKEPVIEKHEEE